MALSLSACCWLAASGRGLWLLLLLLGLHSLKNESIKSKKLGARFKLASSMNLSEA
jgi:hypothetical protein